MKNISVSNDIIPVGQFKANLAKYLKDIQAHKNSLIITQNGKPAGVLISPKEFLLLKTSLIFLKKEGIVPELSIDQIREILYKNYRIVYLIKKNSIEILTVFEGYKLLDKENIIT